VFPASLVALSKFKITRATIAAVFSYFIAYLGNQPQKVAVHDVDNDDAFSAQALLQGQDPWLQAGPACH
jgi:hypothetical protein